MTDKKIVAVIFGGRSVEHDVSVLTGLQFLEALNPTKYEGLAVYIDPLGQWWCGDALVDRANYPISPATFKAMRQITLDLAPRASGRPRFTWSEKGMLGEKTHSLPFDIAVPAIHGSNGEDGTLQGLLDFSGIPYTGCRVAGAAVTMDKVATKNWARNAGLPVLAEALIKRPARGAYLDDKSLASALKAGLADSGFPYCVKPCNLGSSVGVSKAADSDGLMASLLSVFRLDSEAMVEPFVQNLVEYNIAVRRNSAGAVVTGSIERPSSEADLLDFKNKYLSGAKKGPKVNTSESQGMASLNRELDPSDLTQDQAKLIRETAVAIFDGLKLAGSVRLDFLGNEKTGELWFNEANTIPGSFAYFLWENAETPLSFLELTDAMITEGFDLSASRLGQTDTASGGASIFGA